MCNFVATAKWRASPTAQQGPDDEADAYDGADRTSHKAHPNAGQSDREPSKCVLTGAGRRAQVAAGDSQK